MFESTIFQSKQMFLSKIDTKKQFVSLEEILNNPEIEQAYKNYFRAEAEWWIYQEKIRRKLIPYVDYFEPEIQKFYQKQNQIFLEKFRFDLQTLKKIIDSASKTRLNMLLRPRTTLKWFIYRGEPTKTLEEILLRMAYFEDNKYLLEGFYNWIDNDKNKRKFEDILSVIEFVNVIEKIDNDCIIDFSPEDFVDFINPLFSFYNFGDNIAYSTEIPVEALVIFLNDKGVNYISERLEKKLIEGNLDSISKKHFIEFIYEVMNEFDNSSAVNNYDKPDFIPDLQFDVNLETDLTKIEETSDGFINDDMEETLEEEAIEDYITLELNDDYKDTSHYNAEKLLTFDNIEEILNEDGDFRKIDIQPDSFDNYQNNLENTIEEIIEDVIEEEEIIDDLLSTDEDIINNINLDNEADINSEAVINEENFDDIQFTNDNADDLTEIHENNKPITTLDEQTINNEEGLNELLDMYLLPKDDELIVFDENLSPDILKKEFDEEK